LNKVTPLLHKHEWRNSKQKILWEHNHSDLHVSLAAEFVKLLSLEKLLIIVLCGTTNRIKCTSRHDLQLKANQKAMNTFQQS